MGQSDEETQIYEEVYLSDEEHREGKITITTGDFFLKTGEIPVNTSGGLKSKGHPVGATGTAQAYEVYLQLTGQAEKRQIREAGIGLTHNVGGSGATAVVHVYRRE